ncbi:chromosome partitioning protein [Streptococcus porcinus]|uniref:ParB/RepB/Spo0J family partition protein n=1 Tax=Streptococcus porcinus TaxID=1340 RepID=A0A4V0A5J3_STRPO|nr:ParB/RepB/Spo0J family partition protein [Streptococcus porcinus]MBA2795531.1 ParB/RepB/Spo0J family partition protein [Streptococcus porcinus]VTS47914.1 chromosome partitioning protein [Streptococcus porcinus]
MTEELKEIKIEDIVANPYQPRLHFNHDELKELANSIKINGLIQPIIVRPSEIYGYELIAGERRLKASQLAGLEKVPAIIKNISTTESMHQAIVENLQRSDLNPIEEAKAFQTILTKKQLTHEQLATFMGKSRPYITNSIRLLQLPDIILSALEEGKISTGHARSLVTLNKSQDQENYFHRIIDQDLSVRQTEQLVKLKKQTKKPQIDKDIFIKALEEELAKSLGLSIHIKLKKDGSGQLSCLFHDDEELNRIINKLK